MTCATFGIVASEVRAKKNKPKGEKGTRLDKCRLRPDEPRIENSSKGSDQTACMRRLI